VTERDSPVPAAAPRVQAMSDRRTVLLVTAALIAVIGAVVAVASLMALGDPRWRGGELGAPVDVGGPVITALLTGLLLALAGASTATGLVRAQLRRRDRSRPRDRGGRIVP
jgi:cytosine/uracil/thiamine/allantoin permease